MLAATLIGARQIGQRRKRLDHELRCLLVWALEEAREAGHPKAPTRLVQATDPHGSGVVSRSPDRT